MLLSRFTRLLMLTFLCSSLSTVVSSQTPSKPIAITIDGSKQVSPGEQSYVTVQFKIPKGIWMGAQGSQGRTPPGTKIKTPKIAGFTFGTPQYPEAVEEWVPAKLGKTKVYKELVQVIVPFTVGSNVKEGEYNLNFELSYTPGYNAGRLSTHNNEVYSTTIRVSNSASNVSVPSPSLGEVSSDFYVKPKSFDHVPNAFKFLFNPLNEGGGFTKALHKIWLDKPGHGKSVRFMPFPFLSTTNITGSSAGMGASFFNATKEGTMTAVFSMSAYANNLIGGAVGVQAISCPGAYHNYQFSAFFGGEGYRDISLDYENFTYANSLIGVDVTFRSLNEPRMRFFGIGAFTEEEDETAYEKTQLNGILDLYVLPVQNLRIGVGVGYDNYDVGISFDDVIDTEEISFLQESPLTSGLIGLDGGTATSFRANIIYDHRDQEFAPSRGFFAKMTVATNSLSEDIEDISSYTSLDVDMRQYFSGPSQKLVVLMRAGLSLKSESDLPFNLLSSLGGPASSRAYDFERYKGQHSAFGCAEMRYTFFTIPVLGYPMSIEMGTFVDVGQVFGDGTAFGDELNVDPGISMRMINKPNVGLILNYAYGNDGGYFTGGIGLPF